MTSTFRLAFVPLLTALLGALAAHARDSDYYGADQRLLLLDPQRIAVLYRFSEHRREPAEAHLSALLTAAGIQVERIEAHPISGWFIVWLDTAARSQAAVEAAVAAAAATNDIEFATRGSLVIMSGQMARRLRPPMLPAWQR